MEDHLYHMTELLERLGGTPDIYAQLTVVCLDRPGPDTRRTVAEWLAACPGLQVVAALDDGQDKERDDAPARDAGDGAGAGAGPRVRPLPAAAFASAHRLCQVVAAALRPGGLLLQDIQLATLSFIPADRWWESIYLASTVRGMFAERLPTCRFVSNKRGYEATFGRDLLDAGFDPREVIDKAEIVRAAVPLLTSFLDRAFPLVLRLAAPGRDAGELRVARCDGERGEVEAELDLLIWDQGDGLVELGGSGLAEREAPRRRVALRAGNHETLTWSALVADRLAGGPGLDVLDVGARVAPPGAGRAEVTNAAARHIHTLRSRLKDPAAIVTAHHAYRLSDRLSVGHALPHLRAPRAPS